MKYLFLNLSVMVMSTFAFQFSYLFSPFEFPSFISSLNSVFVVVSVLWVINIWKRKRNNRDLDLSIFSFRYTFYWFNTLSNWSNQNCAWRLCLLLGSEWYLYQVFWSNHIVAQFENFSQVVRHYDGSVPVLRCLARSDLRLRLPDTFTWHFTFLSAQFTCTVTSTLS